MACLSCHCLAKAFVYASLSTNNNDSVSLPSPPHSSARDPKPSIPTTKTKTTSPTLPRKQRHQSKLQKQLNLIRIERAIGAGSYRDSEPNGLEQHSNSTVQGLLPDDAGGLEGSVEKKLRETGEWLTDKTEGQFRSSGKQILMFFFKWVLPIYIFMFLVTSGIVELPFSTPFLDDLLM
ncbi:probable NAD(P)H dehydrogenase subunit CRR3, chloroplastic isoform X2 [Ricinus communis]|uniref:probable NAD(P)H dehydrogenase subunit CRR3, chloroplastic isoform X2 n=1 Tax=Ricinus communis TaxID=3988 RepID=UPI00077266EA|nr:probable NAD(P)H dehydrogenase subunit CRR3, chloroplastic isoform X2 [Ricinus communis]|eukprot:XP_015580033.1 probable NAD(P)H dehydrogenase subunit CRR3, chloroplastic isoform X2 [Ricinus communis]